ncbi:MAG: hypothetical protein HY342_07375 [Candidatus Lambdaproteobacteria bacterium]|nr:hypothetical protein [Candidatus Lambdaproteobacteria bacterium]
MTQSDQIAEVRAGLELVLQENANLLRHFTGLLRELNALGELPAPERHKKFRAIEARGAFSFNGVDIRRFAPTSQQLVSPAEFLRRTRRRLVNTVGMINEFTRRGAFANGARLIADIEGLTARIIDETDTREVVAFRGRVDQVRNTPLFQEYLGLKQRFIREDPEFKTEADLIAARETAQENHDYFLSREAELSLLGKKLEKGDLKPDDAKRQLDDLALAFDS